MAGEQGLVCTLTYGFETVSSGSSWSMEVVANGLPVRRVSTEEYNEEIGSERAYID